MRLRFALWHCVDTVSLTKAEMNGMMAKKDSNYLRELLLGLRASHWRRRHQGHAAPRRPMVLSNSLCFAMDVARTSSHRYLLST